MPTTAEVTLQRHPHAFAVIVLERPADERFGVDMVASNDVSDETIVAMIRGVALHVGAIGDEMLALGAAMAEDEAELERITAGIPSPIRRDLTKALNRVYDALVKAEHPNHTDGSD